jgi:hypothetical protein
MRMTNIITRQIYATIAALVTMIPSLHADETCPPNTEPTKCAELQLTKIGKIFGDYQNDIARLQREIDELRARQPVTEIVIGNRVYATQQRNTNMIAEGSCPNGYKTIAFYCQRLIPLSQVGQYLGLAGQIQNVAGFEFFES